MLQATMDNVDKNQDEVIDREELAAFAQDDE
jgi:hypothetical protein